MSHFLSDTQVSLRTATSIPAKPTLAARLDAILSALDGIRSFGADPAVEALVACQDLGGLDGPVIRRIRLVDGRTLAVAAVPSATWHHPAARSSVQAFRRAAGRTGRRLLLVTEAYLNREPRLANALLVAGCGNAYVAPRDRLSVLAALTEAGGDLLLGDAAGAVVGSDDPVAAVLALVAGRVLAIDLDRPVGPATRVTVALQGTAR